VLHRQVDDPLPGLCRAGLLLQLPGYCDEFFGDRVFIRSHGRPTPDRSLTSNGLPILESAVRDPMLTKPGGEQQFAPQRDAYPVDAWVVGMPQGGQS